MNLEARIAGVPTSFKRSDLHGRHSDIQIILAIDVARRCIDRASEIDLSTGIHRVVSVSVHRAQTQCHHQRKLSNEIQNKDLTK
ncbi:hypothetical protein WM15_26690 [Burkholderia ubonensis]|nr:hypothetical protein WM15_26690 [Burkholderia ubonensis]